MGNYENLKEQMYCTIIQDLSTAILKQSEVIGRHMVNASSLDLEVVKYTNKLLKQSTELLDKINNYD